MKSVKYLLKQHFIITQNSEDDTSISSFSIQPKKTRGRPLGSRINVYSFIYIK